MSRKYRLIALIAVLISALSLAGCNANIGVGMNVGIPIGDHGFMSVGTSRWL